MLVSFLAVLIVYFIYNRLSRTPEIPAGITTTPAGQLADVCEMNSQIGKVGEVGIGAIKNARYTVLNDQKQVEREFGFQELLHQDGNDWEIEKPYMNIFRKSFNCTMTAERAKVAVEIAGGKVTPKQGMLIGNITIRIIPNQKENGSETTLLLDDIAFFADKSIFSTAGPIEVISENLRLTGSGVEIVYNGDEERLERLQITNLQSLRIKKWSDGTVLQSTPDTIQNQKGQNANTKKNGKYYKCILDKNVRIETPNERMLADALLINDIFIPGGSSEDISKESSPDMNIPVIEPAKTSAIASDESPSDVIITCDEGITVVPMSTPAQQKETAKINYAEFIAQQDANAYITGKTTFKGQTITYSAETGEAVALGPSCILFDANEKTQDGAGKPSAVRLFAGQKAIFSPGTNKCSFQGDCRCTVSQQDGKTSQQYIIMADNLQIEMAKKNPNIDSIASMDVNHLLAYGPSTHLASMKKIENKIVTAMELKCSSIDFDTATKDFLAKGPGLIKVDNSQTDEPQEKLGRFSLRRKCYAFLRNFDTLSYSGQSSHLIAENKDGSLLADYLPLAENKTRDKIAVTASRIEGDIAQTAAGRMELKKLAARGAVSYEDKDTQVIGSEFLYDWQTSSIDIRGDKVRPCNFNGAILDSVRFDTKSGKWNTRLKGPGAIR